jgi:hypothetical protein
MFSAALPDFGITPATMGMVRCADRMLASQLYRRALSLKDASVVN